MTSNPRTIAKISKPLICPPRREKALPRAVIGRDQDPTGSAVAFHVGIRAILHKTHGEGTVTIMYLRKALESSEAQTHRQTLGFADLFDNVMCSCEQARRDRDANRPSRLQIDDELKLGGVLNRQVSCLRPSEDAMDIAGGATQL